MQHEGAEVTQSMSIDTNPYCMHVCSVYDVYALLMSKTALYVPYWSCTCRRVLVYWCIGVLMNKLIKVIMYYCNDVIKK